MGKWSPSLYLFRAGLANFFCEGPDNKLSLALRPITMPGLTTQLSQYMCVYLYYVTAVFQ